MKEIAKTLAEWSASIIEIIGILIIAGVGISVLVWAAVLILKRHSASEVFRPLRQRLGRGILLGLEFLVAADIIHTVAVELNFYTVGVLAGVVLIRTFLSFTLDVELTGRWPWQEESAEK
jgi:uncharacterized membrane protein